MRDQATKRQPDDCQRLHQLRIAQRIWPEDLTNCQRGRKEKKKHKNGRFYRREMKRFLKKDF